MIEEVGRKIVRKGDRLARIGERKRRVAHGIQALRQRQVVRIEIVLREPIGRIDGPEADQRNRARLPLCARSEAQEQHQGSQCRGHPRSHVGPRFQCRLQFHSRPGWPSRALRR